MILERMVVDVDVDLGSGTQHTPQPSIGGAVPHRQHRQLAVRPGGLFGPQM